MLILNRPAVPTHPLPDVFQESLLTDLAAVNALSGKVVLNDVLGRDARVVRPRQPQGRVALHAPPPDQRVLNGRRKGVAKMQLSRDVRRGHHDNKGLTVRIDARLEITALLPPLIASLLKTSRIVSGWHLCRAVGVDCHERTLQRRGLVNCVGR